MHLMRNQIFFEVELHNPVFFNTFMPIKMNNIDF